MENNFSKGQQLYINGKWYMDIKDVDQNQIKVRIKYYEGNDKKYYAYKIISLPISMFTDIEQTDYITKAKIDPIELKKRIGSLINRLVKETDMSMLFEDGGALASAGNTAGMGAVSSPGMSGTPGVPGAAGSGDIGGGGILPASEFGLMRHPKVNKKIRKKLKTKVGKAIVKQPVILLTKENNEETVVNSENDYKNLLYEFLDYPTDNDIDIQFLEIINKLRPTFLELSSQRIKAYFKKLYEVNKSLINTKTSEWFQNNLFILGEITETEEI